MPLLSASSSRAKARFSGHSSARWLGYGGLIPFIAGASALWWLPAPWTPFATEALVAYGAVILSFLGAVHWGLWLAEIPTDHHTADLRLAWGITPALIAWIALLVAPATGLIILFFAMGTALAADLKARSESLVPAWYGALRIRLSIGAMGSLAAAYPALSA